MPTISRDYEFDEDPAVLGATGDGADHGVSVEVARRIAERAHDGQVDEDGEPYICHVARVAAAVPLAARPVAWLHDVTERSEVDESMLTDAGASAEQCLALRLLSRDTAERSDVLYLDHVRSIALAPGPAGRISRAVKRADLLDRISHLSTRRNGWTPPYRAAFTLLTITRIG